MHKQFTIGQLAKAAKVNVETIRYYQRIQLIEQPKKPSSGYRIYSIDSLKRLHFINRAKSLGFSLTEIRQLLSISDKKCDAAKEIGHEKLNEIQQKIKDLTKIATALESYTQLCANNSNPTHCPLLENLLFPET